MIYVYMHNILHTHTHLNVCLNARGLVSKIDILKMQIYEMEIDIIGVTETFLNNDVTPAEINIEGYTMHRKDRCNFKRRRSRWCHSIYKK